MKKKITAVVLCIALIAGCIPFASMAVEAESAYVMSGNYLYSLFNDAATNTVPAEFGNSNKSANGRVWTDKSVVTQGDGFKITMSALSQEYMTSTDDMITESIGVDVAMAIDVTGSMDFPIDGNDYATKDQIKKGDVTRAYEMVKALNDSIEIIMQANPNNRVLIYGYAGTSSTYVILELGHYTNDSWGNEASHTESDYFDVTGKYLGYTWSSSTSKIKTNSDLKKNGTKYSQKSISIDGGTNTQRGIAVAAEKLVEGINSTTANVPRVPFFLLFTDGDVNKGYKNWYNAGGDSYSNNTDYGYEDVAYTILTSAYEKQRLKNAYYSYNQKVDGNKFKNRAENEPVWFNIGLIAEDNRTGLTQALVQPTTIKDSSVKDVTNALNTITKGANQTDNNYKYLTDNGTYELFSTNENYVYADKYAYFADSADTLKARFNDLANAIAEVSRVRAVPVINQVEHGAESLSNLVFTDKLGKGMKLDEESIVLIPSETGTAVKAAKSNNQYTFKGYGTTVTVSTSGDQQVVTIVIPPDEIGLFAFADASDLDNGKYDSAEPVKVEYNVVPDSLSGEKIYSNAFGDDAEAKAEFYVLHDNPYYYDITLSPDDNSFVSSSLKEKFVKGDIENKEENLTGSMAYVDSETFNATIEEGKACKITNYLGNNGLIKPVAKIEKTSDADSVVYPGDEITYTITVTNLDDEDIEDIKISDVIPDNTILVPDSEKASEGGKISSDDDGNISMTVDKAEPSGKVVFEYKVTVDDDAEPGTEIKPENPTVTEIDETKVDDLDETKENENLEVEVGGKHKVIYEFKGDVPSGKTVPKDDNEYKVNESYTVDTTYTSSTVIETKDDYENVNGQYTFSGWEDPNDGKMGNDDVTITGTWTYKSIKVPTHNVKYIWKDDVHPDGVTLPTDGKDYVKGESYNVSDAYVSSDPIEVKDEYKNVIGTYTFTGWTDPGTGVMGENDVTIVGEWKYEENILEKYHVTYDFGEYTPAGKELPVDDHDYVNNEPYEAESTVLKTGDTFKDMDGDYVKGTWTFQGWSPKSGNIPEKDVEIVGQWKYTDADKYTIVYVWDGDAPTGVTPPTDNKEYYIDEDYTVKSVNSPVIDDQGKWTFDGWDTESGTIPGNLTIKGTWSMEKPKSIEYDWGEYTPEGLVLPEDDNDYYDGDEYTVDTDDIIKKGDTFIDDDGNKWTFDGWDNEGGTVGDKDITITPKWIKEEGKTITYNWGEYTPDGKSVPVDETKYHEGDDYTIGDESIIKEGDSFIDSEGNKWTFKGWDDKGGKFGDKDLEVTADWLKENGKTITYDWGDEFDPGIKPPVDDKIYHDGDKYEVNTDDVIKKGDTFIDEDGNKWTFDGWDNDGGEIDGSDITIKPKWTKEEGKTIIYNWGEYTPDGKSVPVDETKYHEGDDYTIGDESIIKEGDSFIDSEGNKWTFKGWDDKGGKFGDKDLEVTADWLKENGKTITYDWGDEFDPGIEPPVDDKIYHDGDKYEVNTDDVIKKGDSFIDNDDNKWIFDGWESEGGTVGDDDIIIKPKWTKEEAKSITYEWTGDVPETETLPTDSKNYYKDDEYTIDTTYTSGTVIPDYDDYNNVIGHWDFSGWDTESGKFGEKDMTVKGEWEYISTPATPNTVTYLFTGNVPEGALAPVDENTYVNNQPYNVDTTFTTESKINHYDEFGNIDGEYTFGGWNDPNSGIMDEDGVTITGEWTYTPVEVPTHTVEFTEKSDDENTDPGAETITITNGDKIIVDPNGGDWTYGGTTYTDGEKAEIVITEDISIPDPERDGYEFTGWTVTEEDGVTVLKANWEKKNNWIIPVVVAGTVGGVITGAVIAGGIATAITGGVLAVPAAVLIGKAIKDNASDNNQTDNSGNNSNSDIPDTGSTSPKLAAFALVSSAAAAAYVILSRKKEED